MIRSRLHLLLTCVLAIVCVLELLLIVTMHWRLAYATDSMIVFRAIINSGGDRHDRENAIKGYYPAGTRIADNSVEGALVEEARQGFIDAVRRSCDTENPADPLVK